MKRYLLFGIIGIVACYAIYVVAVISWPSPLRRPASEIQLDYEGQFKAGMSRAELQTDLDRRKLKWQYSEHGNYLSADIGSYTTADFLFIFPMATIVRAKWYLNEKGNLEKFEISKYSDGP